VASEFGRIPVDEVEDRDRQSIAKQTCRDQDGVTGQIFFVSAMPSRSASSSNPAFSGNLKT
jgi:hypothetical protein